ncbi:MAG TPA: hypothetical protein VHL53_02430 [Acidimicrobiia bacterium]|nr:hypothetical protein [Acidimicrobiia bacterium]
MGQSRRTHYLPPAIDGDTAGVLDQAIDTLAKLRGMDGNGAAAATVHLLASLIAETQQRLHRAVADARNQDCSWAEIADLLGVTRASAWQRFAGVVSERGRSAPTSPVD